MNGDSVGARLWALIVSPGQAMAWVAERPLWLVAGVIIFLGLALFTAATIHIAGPEQKELMRDTRFGQMIPEEDWQRDYEESFDPSLGSRVFQGLSGGFGVWVFTFIYAAVFLLFSKLAAGPATFKQILGVTYWAHIVPYVLGSALRLPLIFAKDPPTVMGVSIGLAALAPEADLLSAKYQALMYFGDFFTWWGLVIMIIGFQKVNGFARGKAALVVLLPWLLITGVVFGIGRLFL